MLGPNATTSVAGSVHTGSMDDLKVIVLYIGRKDRRPATIAIIAREVKARSDEYASHHQVSQARIPSTTRPCTSVSRKSRPAWRKVSRV